MGESILIKNANLLYKGEMIPNSYVLIEDGKVISVNNKIGKYDRVIDANGLKMLPGIVDTHNDTIEYMIAPRRRTFFLNQNSIIEMITNFLSSGVTCFYFTLTVSPEPTIRSVENCKRIIKQIKSLVNNTILEDNVKIHLRYEATLNLEKYIENFIEFSDIDVFCVNDHSPNGITGWSREKFIRNLKSRCSISLEEENRMINDVNKYKEHSIDNLRYVIEQAQNHNIPIGIHDLSDINQAFNLGIKRFDFAEFPRNIEVIRVLKNMQLPVILGAPNVILGGSQFGNVSAEFVVKKGLCDILCSDYKSSSLLLAAYKLAKLHNGDISKVWSLISSTPASIFRAKEKGELIEGRDADFIFIDDNNGNPRVVETYIKGKQVYKSIV